MGERSVKSYLYRPREELFDLKNDPKELKNLATDARHSDTLAKLRGRLRTWQRQTNDPWTILFREQ